MYSLPPTKKQAALLRKRMRQQNDFFDECTKVAIREALLGRSLYEIEKQIKDLLCNHAVLSDSYFHRALNAVRTNAIELLHKLQAG